eukprot:3371239-Rhodomonas_salina.1
MVTRLHACPRSSQHAIRSQHFAPPNQPKILAGAAADTLKRILGSLALVCLTWTSVLAMASHSHSTEQPPGEPGSTEKHHSRQKALRDPFQNKFTRDYVRVLCFTKEQSRVDVVGPEHA